MNAKDKARICDNVTAINQAFLNLGDTFLDVAAEGRITKEDYQVCEDISAVLHRTHRSISQIVDLLRKL